MGKTEGGAVWLDPEKTSPFDFFQFWRNTADADVRKVFLQLTMVPVDEVESLCKAEGAAINDAKVRLAFEVTKLVHGEQIANAARETASQLFSKGQGTGNEPEVTLGTAAFGSGMGILDVLTNSGVTATKSEARRLIEQGGLTINGNRVDDVKYVLGLTDINGDEGCLIRKGKKHYYRLRISN
jgi:tyrosyl-tRNA synthetase